MTTLSGNFICRFWALTLIWTVSDMVCLCVRIWLLGRLTRCKQDRMPKSIVWILFISKFEVEREIETNIKKRKGERRRDRLRGKLVTTAVDPVVSCWFSSFGLLCGGGSMKRRIQWVLIHIQVYMGMPKNLPCEGVLHCLTQQNLNLLQSFESLGRRPEEWVGDLWESLMAYDPF